MKSPPMKILYLIVFLLVSPVFGQNATSVNKPAVLSANPGTCGPGDWWFDSSIPSFRGCAVTNTPTNLGAATPGLPLGGLQINNGGLLGGITLGGDCTFVSPNIVCTKTNGSPFVASATTDTTNAANIGSGTLPAARLPNPSAATLGGIQSLAPVASKWINTISTSGIPSATQPNFTDLLGTLAVTQTPLATNNSLLIRDNTGAINQITAATIGNGNCLGVNAGQFTGLGPCPGGGGGGSGGGVNTQTISYTAVIGDAGKLITMNGAGLTLTLPAAPPSATWFTIVENLNATPLTISRNGLNINGVAANFSVPQYQWVRIYTDNTNYFADAVTSAGSGITLTTSSTSVAVAVNTAVIPSIATVLQGDNTTVFSTTGTTAYVGSPASGCSTATLKSGAIIWLIADTASLTSASFNFCGLGIKNIKKTDGVTDPGGTILANVAAPYQYDGTVWRRLLP